MKWILLAFLWDPTTYVTPSLYLHSAHQDWSSSQPYFRAGWLESNPRFTISGQPDSIPVSYEDGEEIIRRDAIQHLAISYIHNTTSRFFQSALERHYPSHKKLIHWVGLMERIGFCSFNAYIYSHQHYHQAHLNHKGHP